jgi:hypothetical protein
MNFIVSIGYVGKISLFGKLWFEDWYVGLGNECNVGRVSFFFFLREGEKNKINSFKFALSYQKAKTFLFTILSLSYLVVVCLFILVANLLVYIVLQDKNPNKE